MSTNCASLAIDLIIFCYESDFMLSLSDKNQADIVEAFNPTSRFLDDLLNIDNPYFAQIVSQIYLTELQLNKILKPLFRLRLVHYKWHSFNQNFDGTSLILK